MSENLTALFKLHPGNEASFTASITLHHQGNQPLENWDFHFCFCRRILEKSIKNAILLENTGDYHRIRPVSQQPLIPGDSFIVEFNFKSKVSRYSDTPTQFFITTNSKGGSQAEVIPVKKLKADLDLKRNASETSDWQKFDDSQISLIPHPAKFEKLDGYFEMTPETTLNVEKNNHDAKQTALFLQEMFSHVMGYELPITEGRNEQSDAINFFSSPSKRENGEEAYQLLIDSDKISIFAQGSAGFFYGIMTLKQLLPPQMFAQKLIPEGSWVLPSVSIEDQPRFAYRGILLDVSRHFHSVAVVKRLIDLMAHLKMNVFHWHLTDDEGWRIEIKSYPELTDVGAWRGYGMPLPPHYESGPSAYGGYYSQEEVREIVAYAHQRQIQVVPEIDIPGHCRAILKSLPHLLTDPEDQSDYRSIQNFKDNVLSPGLESTYEVLFTILDEVMDLFPESWIHVGADEVPEGVWEKSSACQKLMLKEGLNNVSKLQSYFLSRIQQKLKSRGRTMAGWEEILVGGRVTKDAVVYSWKGEEAGIRAAQAGHPVVMLPAQYLYLDQAYSEDPEEPGLTWAGTIDLEKIYSYEPIRGSISQSGRKNIIGVQGALWSELIDTQEKMDYMLFPRITALAEIAWSPQTQRNWENFAGRIPLFFKRLDYYGVQYHSF